MRIGRRRINGLRVFVTGKFAKPYSNSCENRRFHTNSCESRRQRGSLAVQEMRLGGQHAGEKEKLLEQLRSVLERDGQQALSERNSLRQAGYRLLIRQHDLDRAGSGFGFELDDPADDGLVNFRP